MQGDIDLGSPQQGLIALLEIVGLSEHEIIECNRLSQVRGAAQIEIAFLQRGGRLEELGRRARNVVALGHFHDPPERLLGSDRIANCRAADAEGEFALESMFVVQADARGLIQVPHRRAK